MSGDGSSLDGRVIAIAGVGGGLGPVVAKRLADAGAIVAGANRGQDEVDALGAELGLGERWDGRALDLTDEDAVAGWRDGLLERFGRVDGLVHLVGGWRGGQPLHEEPLADWDLLHQLLIRTVQLTTRAFHDQLAASAHGRFVLVSAKQAQRRATATPPTPRRRRPPRPGRWPTRTASGWVGRPPTSSSSTRS